jgi:ABC-type dipeptide/oligopeptide/nickel transport system permease subunit
MKISSIFITTILILTLLYGLGISISNYDYNQIDAQNILNSPSLINWFGTDALGRDLFIRIIHGAKMSLAIAFLTALNAWLIGSVLGILAGYLGGIWDEIISRFIDFIYSLPDLLVLSVIALFLSKSTSGIVIGLAFISWMDVARLTRVEIKKYKEADFTESARALGLSHLEIIFKHLYPNALPSIFVALSFIIPRAILAESTLSFIGLGLSPPDTSWGTLTGDAWQYLYTDPHLLVFPALMIFMTVFSFNFIGDSLAKSFKL